MFLWYDEISLLTIIKSLELKINNTQIIQIPQPQKMSHTSFSCFEIRLKKNRKFWLNTMLHFLTGYSVPNKRLFMFCSFIWKFRWRYFEVLRYLAWSIFYPGKSNSTSKRVWHQSVTCHVLHIVDTTYELHVLYSQHYGIVLCLPCLKVS